MQKNIPYINGLKPSEAAIAVTVHIGIFSLQSYSLLVPLPQLSQYLRPIDVIFKNASMFPCLRFSMFLLVKIHISKEFLSPLDMFSGNIPTSLSVGCSFTALVLQELSLLWFFSLSTATPSGSVGWCWLIL